MNDDDRDWLVTAYEGDTPIIEACVATPRLRRLATEGLVERRWSPRDGWLVLLTPKGKQLAREWGSE